MQRVRPSWDLLTIRSPRPNPSIQRRLIDKWHLGKDLLILLLLQHNMQRSIRYTDLGTIVLMAVKVAILLLPRPRLHLSKDTIMQHHTMELP